MSPRILTAAAILAGFIATAQAQEQPPTYSQVVGTEVRTQAGNILGTVSDVVRRQDHLVAVIDVGEDLAAMGVEQKRIAVDWDALSPAPSGDALVADMTMAQLAEAPDFLGPDRPAKPEAR